MSACYYVYHYIPSSLFLARMVDWETDSCTEGCLNKIEAEAAGGKTPGLHRTAGEQGAANLPNSEGHKLAADGQDEVKCQRRRGELRCELKCSTKEVD